MKELKFRNLTKDEVEVRVGGGQSLLLYKTARVDAYVLDETVGQANWQKRFYQVKNTMICSVGINVNFDDTNKEPLWVWKDDAGDDDYTMEKVKAEASDSFKRAAFAWGIGRSLYNAPKMKLPDEFKGKQFFDVSVLEYDQDNNISKIVITTDWGKTIVYQWEKGVYNPKPKKESVNPVAKADTIDENAPIRNEELELLFKWIKEITEERYANFQSWLKKTFGVEDVADLTASQGIIVVNRLGLKK